MCKFLNSIDNIKKSKYNYKIIVNILIISYDSKREIITKILTGGLAVNKIKKPVFFIVFFVIAFFTLSQVFGISSYYGDIKHTYIKSAEEIRWGIDIRGGVDVTFTPPDGIEATDEQMDSAKEVIALRLVSLGITDSECYVDYKNDRIIVRFPWKSEETNFNPEEAVKELGETAMLTFREGKEVDSMNLPTGITKENVILKGEDVVEAYVSQDNDKNYVVALKLSDEGKTKFAEVTTRLAPDRGIISIWMDETMISYPNVNDAITDGNATISGGFTYESAKSLADKINSGALPFKLETASFSTISPTLGLGARDAMVLSGILALILIAIFMIIVYRLPGFVAVIALIGQVAGMIAAVSGYFGFMDSATLTIPGIAGIILSIGMGVDANVITSERIKEELKNGKTLDGAINAGFNRGFTSIFDGNITNVIVAVILMGAFGVPDSIFAKALKWVFFMFGPSTEGTVYSLGYTLLVGIILNFIMAVTASKLMLVSLSKFKFLRNPRLYGGVKNNA